MKILHLEDNRHDAMLVREIIHAEWPDCAITLLATRDDYIKALRSERYDLILSDFTLASFDGPEALQVAQQEAPNTPFIFLTGTIGEDRAIEAVRSGANDYILKDQMKRLLTAIRRAIEESAEKQKRRQAEAHILELGDYLNKARDAVMVTDLRHRVTYWNQGAEAISGWSETEALGRTAEEIFGPLAAMQIDAGRDIATGTGDWVGEVEILTRNGAVRLLELRITLIRDNAGRTRAALAIGTDITDRKQAERRIREQAEMLNQAREAIIIIDPETRIIYWSAGARRLYGWSSAEVMGRRIDQFFSGHDLEQLRLAWEQTYAKGEWQGETRFRTRHGREVIIETRNTLVRDEMGRAKALLSINSDITEQKQLEEKFLRSQRMENIGLLAAGIAHDLNNVLVPILMSAPMLRDKVSDAEGLSLLGILEKSAERGAGLVRQILAFAHGAGGPDQIVQVKQLLRDVAAVVISTFPKTIRLEENCANTLWPIKANPTQVHQVLLNLCINARDAMPDGGTLRINARNRVLDAHEAQAMDDLRAGPYLLIEVEDTGTGIPPDILERIWEPFFTTKADKGTGLGLSTVRGIVKSHHGHTELSTELGRGTTFRIYLPALAASPSPVAPLRASPVARGEGELILVVDDEKTILDMTATVLEQHGYRVLPASDGGEAIALFTKEAANVRLVISDMRMPNLDGAVLAQVVQQINPNVKIIAMSGLSPESEHASEIPKSLIGAFLAKPFKASELLLKVHELLHPKVQTNIER